MRRRTLFLFLFCVGAVTAIAVRGTVLTNPLTTVNGKGTLQTVTVTGPIDINNAFFQDLGTNGRTCNSCHVSSAAWSITPDEVQTRFNRTAGLDPIFSANDGANCPSADMSTLEARRVAYSQLLEKGLIRVAIGVPPGAEFEITAIADPYACAETTRSQPAFYRRPLPSTNLPFLTTVMWDGRESPKGGTLRQNLSQQAIDATLGHAQAAQPPSPEQVKQIVDFEIAMYTAQAAGQKLGDLSAGGGNAGAMNLAAQEFYEGINDVLGADPNGRPFDSVAFTTFKGWLNSPDPNKASVARGEVLFNTFPIPITGVAGLNDLPNLQSLTGTCTTCHDSPNVGNHSVSLAIDIGITAYPAHNLDIAGLPVYTVRCNATGRTVQVTDLGRAMVTGRCADIGKTKGPVLRGLAARAPYFHNGGAKTLDDAVEFYDQRFNLSLTDQQKKDLVAFLEAL